MPWIEPHIDFALILKTTEAGMLTLIFRMLSCYFRILNQIEFYYQCEAIGLREFEKMNLYYGNGNIMPSEIYKQPFRQQIVCPDAPAKIYNVKYINILIGLFVAQGHTHTDVDTLRPERSVNALLKYCTLIIRCWTDKNYLVGLDNFIFNQNQDSFQWLILKS